MNEGIGQLPRKVVPTLMAIAFLLSAVCFTLVTVNDVGFLHFDTQAHLLIARRVCDSTSPGLAQLGAVWLPLTHLASLPLVCSDIWSNTIYGSIFLAFGLVLSIVAIRRLLKGWTVLFRWVVIGICTTLYLLTVGALRTNVFYSHGLGMIAVSMFCYLVMGYYMFKFVFELTDSTYAAVIAWMVLMLNPNVLYLQSTSMTEIPMYFGVLLSMYTFWKLCKEPSNHKWLFWNGVASVIMCTIRYEGWVIVVAEAAIYTYVLLRNRVRFWDLVGHLAEWGFVALAGVIGWIVWNMTIFGNPLEFQNGTYSSPSNWVSGREAGFGNLRVAFLTYGWGIWDTIGMVVVLAVIGLFIYVISTRLRRESFAPLLPLVMIPFFGFMIYKGQRPMQVMQTEDTLYNIRFALIIILTVAPMVGYLVRRSRVMAVIVGGCVLFSQFALFQDPGITTLIEPQRASSYVFSQLQIEAAEWLGDNYDNGTMLLEAYGNEQLQFLSGINLGNITYEGTYRLWEPVLNAPYANQMEWIIMRGPYSGFAEDRVWTTVRNQQSFIDHYVLVFENELYHIYKLAQ